MIRKLKVEDAIGKPLIHDITAIKDNGFKGVEFSKGHIIEKKDIERLKDIGKNHVYVGHLKPGQIHEEDAAYVLAKEISGPGTDYSDVSEGKISILAKEDGLLKINVQALNKINSLGDYTIASKYNNTKVDKKDPLAGLRIVPLWTDQDTVDQAVKIAKENYPLFELRPFHKLKIGTIITGDEVYYGRIEDAFEGILREKFALYDCELLGFSKSPDEKSIMKEKLEEFLNQGANLVIFTGGMSVDPDDLTPGFIKEVSDRLVTQGVPIQPGNMLTIAMLGDTYLLGLPGASIHSKITSFDTILPRIFAKEYLEKEDFIVLGEGGLY